MAQSPMSALRLYAVAGIDSASAGNGEPLASGTSIVPFRSIGAVVSPAQYSSAKLLEEDVERHAEVVEAVFANHLPHPVLPAPPGTVFKSRDILSRWLELHYFTLTDALTQVEGNLTARVTVMMREGAKLKRDKTIHLETPPVEGAPTDPTKAPNPAKQLQAAAADTFRVLRGKAAGTVSLPVQENEKGVVARASFLIGEEVWPVFNDLVEAESDRHPELELTVSGPWPPYDFVRMQFGA